MRVLLADDHLLFRDSLATLLESSGFEVLGMASDGLEATQMADELKPDLVLLDVEMPNVDGLMAADRILELACDIRVVLLTGKDEVTLLHRALEIGVHGFLTKSLPPQQFLDLLEQLEDGDRPILDPCFSTAGNGDDLRASSGRKGNGDGSAGAARVDDESDPDRLTDREIEVLAAMTEGVTSNRALAAALGISENTVRFHVRNILEKLRLHNRAQAVAHALKEGLIPEATAVEMSSDPQIQA